MGLVPSAVFHRDLARGSARFRAGAGDGSALRRCEDRACNSLGGQISQWLEQLPSTRHGACRAIAPRSSRTRSEQLDGALCDRGAPPNAEPIDRSADRVRDDNRPQRQSRACAFTAWPNAYVARSTRGGNPPHREGDPARSSRSEYDRLLLGTGYLSSPSGERGRGHRSPQKGTRRKFSALVPSPIPRGGLWPPGRARRREDRFGQVNQTETRDQLNGEN